jgi:hypothetical protein
MLDSNRVIKKHLNLAARTPQVVRKQDINRFDEPNMPLETTPRNTTPTPSWWQFTAEGWANNIFNYVDEIRRYLFNKLRLLGLPPIAIEAILGNLTITQDFLYAFMNWFLDPGGVNLPREIFVQILGSMVNNLSPSTVLDNAAWETFYFFEDRGLFLLGDIAAALTRGWTIAQCLQFLKYLKDTGSAYPSGVWPSGWDDALNHMELYPPDNGDDSSGPDQFP